MIVDLMLERDLQTVLHQELSAERKAFVWERFIIYAIEFTNLIKTVRIKSGHLHARKMIIIANIFNLIPPSRNDEMKLGPT